MPQRKPDSFDMQSIQDSFNTFTESVEEHFEIVARSLQDAFKDQTWIPESMRPKSPPPPSRLHESIQHPLGYIEATRLWISEHRAVTAAVVAFVGTGAFIIWRHRRAAQAKKRARRAKNGGKTEVVILSGSPHSALARSLALALEKRGFIVFIATGSMAEEQAVQEDNKPDIRALSLDLTSAQSTNNAIKKLGQLLDTPHNAGSSTTYKLHLAAFILVPPPSYPTGAIVNISSPDWSDILNNHLLAPFTSLHAFLPILSSQKSSLLFLNSSIVPSLTSPSNAPESVVAGAMEKYILTLRREFTSLNIVQLKLGLLDYGNLVPEMKQLVVAQGAPNAESTEVKQHNRKGSPLRELHNNVFDIIIRGKARNGTIFVGRGSRMYDLVGNWMPSSFVNFLVNLRQSKEPVGQRRASTGSSGFGIGSEWENLR